MNMDKIVSAMKKARVQMRAHTYSDEGNLLNALIGSSDLTEKDRESISTTAADLIKEIRQDTDPTIMEVFLAEYGLSTQEGIALMCLAEALLRVPDAYTIDALIEDKIVPSDWGKHLGASSSSLVNASTWALMLTGKVLEDEDEGLIGALRGAVKRMGEPVIRTAVGRAMREMGRQFVLGRDIDEAMVNASELEKKGYTYSYDMLGEAARTERDAKRYHLSYSEAIGSLASACTSENIRNNPGISVKLSALHARYETSQSKRVMEELVPRVRSLALLAKSAGMGFNIDAEESERLDLSLDVIEAVVSDPSLKNWDGLGVVVQAYGKRAPFVLDWLYALAQKLDRKFMVRLVKGAYWDTEIKRSQTLGVDGFPVFTRKASTDVSYISNARKLLRMTDRIYPQFATHNAHTVCAVLAMANNRDSFEFQRLHGMGENLHAKILKREETRCRIYAPVGAHRDLLAYLVRRLLENGANSSFVNQIVDEEISPEEIATDPFEIVQSYIDSPEHPGILSPADIFSKQRKNSKGWDILEPHEAEEIDALRSGFSEKIWKAGPRIAGNVQGGDKLVIHNPARPDERVGEVVEASEADINNALEDARPWDSVDAATRAKVLIRASDLYEQNAGELFALAAREAGKTIIDCVGELREAVDFLRYYASEAVRLETLDPRGVFACISPWNFPLAIFTGQISAALAAGNGVIAKPAEATPLIACKAIDLLHEAGVPKECLQLLPGKGSMVGAALSVGPGIDGMCFTGSTQTAHIINQAMATNLSPDAPLIAETGGLNAMIVDSTALPEQAVRDIVISAFQSAGQRCSALRVLYVQEEIADNILDMVKGAMDELAVANPWEYSTDVGPVIDETAKNKIGKHIEEAREAGRLLKQLDVPSTGNFMGPALIEINSISDLQEEIFGPVLHVAKFSAEEIDVVIDTINATGYGLTFGLHTRIDDRVQHIVDRIHAGNIYVNRNQIGAVVGSQPFGGEGLSGTGPKAGGPHYVSRFKRVGKRQVVQGTKQEKAALLEEVQETIDRLSIKSNHDPLNSSELPGPTGESNRLSTYARGIILCLGPDAASAEAQRLEASSQGCVTVTVAPGVKGGVDGVLETGHLSTLSGFDAVCFWGSEADARIVRQALSARNGSIIPLVTESGNASMYQMERHVCVDTTASGGNTALLAANP